MDLQELGLSKNEAAVFEALLSLGKANAARISKEAGVTYGRIYEILESLEGKGLVKVLPEKTKMFVVSDPERLKEVIADKKKALEELEKKIEAMKRLHETRPKEPVVLARGTRSFYKVLRELPRAKRYSYSIKYTSEFIPSEVLEVKSYKRKGVDYKVLARIDDETRENIKKWLKITKNIKHFENEGFALSIIDDEVVLLVLIKSDVTMLIRDRAFAKGIKRLFETKYATSQPQS